RLVYAEFDDNPVYLLEPETWRSRSGAPWPYLHEYEMGCTWEHAGYHLSWMCALFGPVSRLTAHASRILPDKTDLPLDPPDTPDFSVAVLTFESGVIGRLTCSIAAPSDHRMRIIGNRGMAEADTYRNYDAPVRLWPFDAQSLKAQRARAVRRHPWVAALVGSGGRRVPLSPPAHPPKPAPGPGLSPKLWLSRLRSNQLGAQDKSAGLAELAAALAEDRPHFPPTDFTLHLTELTHAIQAAGPGGASHEMTTRFAPLPDQMAPPSRPDLARYARPAAVPRLVGRLVGRAGP
ncbi:MAG: Gfo/Idh/MocA family oxidoreductase, partial [Pseudomonadota bacterium]